MELKKLTPGPMVEDVKETIDFYEKTSVRPRRLG